MKPLDRLKHHVTGAIERGEKTAIEAVVNKPKHTPGPWSFNGLDIGTDDTDLIPVVANIPDSVTNMADVALISACPEMLDALQAARVLIAEAIIDNMLDTGPATKALAQINAAISKATGGAE